MKSLTLKLINGIKDIFQKIDNLNTYLLDFLLGWIFVSQKKYQTENILSNKNEQYTYQMNTNGVIVRIN